MKTLIGILILQLGFVFICSSRPNVYISLKLKSTTVYDVIFTTFYPDCPGPLPNEHHYAEMVRNDTLFVQFFTKINTIVYTTFPCVTIDSFRIQAATTGINYVNVTSSFLYPNPNSNPTTFDTALNYADSTFALRATSVGPEFAQRNTQLKLWPNPANQSLHFNLENINNDAELRI